VCPQVAWFAQKRLSAEGASGAAGAADTLPPPRPRPTAPGVFAPEQEEKLERIYAGSYRGDTLPTDAALQMYAAVVGRPPGGWLCDPHTDVVWDPPTARAACLPACRAAPSTCFPDWLEWPLLAGSCCWCDGGVMAVVYPPGSPVAVACALPRGSTVGVVSEAARLGECRGHWRCRLPRVSLTCSRRRRR
jgi:hypothetical protein